MCVERFRKRTCRIATSEVNLGVVHKDLQLLNRAGDIHCVEYQGSQLNDFQKVACVIVVLFARSATATAKNMAISM
jgi:hypothetical protein